MANPRRNHAPCRAPGAGWRLAAGGWRLATAIVRQVPIIPAWYVAQWAALYLAGVPPTNASVGTSFCTTALPLGRASGDCRAAHLP